MPFKNPKERREYRKKWYSKNKESEKTHVKKRKLEIKKWILEYKSQLKCENCGEHHPSTIDFHHKKNKEMAISKMVSEGYSIKRIEKEIKKCKILCANCHRKVHWKDKNL